MDSIIQFDHVSKRFGRTIALDDVSITLPAGRVCAILGANGAGKSTAIRLMLGLDESDSGSVHVLGMNSRKKPLEIRNRIGYVADDPVLYDYMTVREIGWFASGFYPAGYQTEYEKLLQRFDLNGDQKIKSLSKGMTAKVALSLAMAHRPELLILDEPTAGLDPLVRREFLESMIDIAAEGRSVFLSSHQVSEVERVADTVIVLLEGRIACIRELEDLKRDILEVVVTLPEATASPPKISGKCLAEVAIGHEYICMVEELDQHQLKTECSRQGLPDSLIRKPSLEEILLAMLRQYRGAARSRNQDESSQAADSSSL